MSRKKHYFSTFLGVCTVSSLVVVLRGLKYKLHFFGSIFLGKENKSNSINGRSIAYTIMSKSSNLSDFLARAFKY